MFWLLLGLFSPATIFGLTLAFGRRLNRIAPLLGLLFGTASLAAAVALFADGIASAPVTASAPWIRITGGLSADVGYYIDPLAAVMVLVVAVISWLVLHFSVSYIKGERNEARYWGYLGLFCAAMFGLVLADNLLLLFVCWELVGFSSYLLIGFWHDRESAALAARNAFWTNRVGDLFMLIGILALSAEFGTVDIQKIIHFAGENGSNPVFLLSGLCLFAGAAAKSAQFPLQVWLPDAMAGPTTASALIHAATMVAAGVYLMARVYPTLPPEALLVIANIGALTAFMGAFAALTQTDIKRVLAFSTISQLGYMTMAVGLGAPQAAVFHLITHAFFKCALFLGSARIIHQLHEYHHAIGSHADAQDLRLMGGLRRFLPLTFVVYLVAAAALVGLPFTSGYLSKELILGEALHFGGLPAVLGFLSVGLTAFYMGRQILLIFWGEFRGASPERPEATAALRKRDWKMETPLLILSFCSLSLLFGAESGSDDGLSWLLDRLKPVYPSIKTVAHSALTPVLSLSLAATGLALAVWLYRRGGLIFPTKGGFLFRLSYENWFQLPVYRALFFQPVKKIALASHWFDEKIVDGLVNLIANLSAQFQVGQNDYSIAKTAAFLDKNLIDGAVLGVAGFFWNLGRFFRALQNGKVQTYLVWTILSILLLALVIW